MKLVDATAALAPAAVPAAATVLDVVDWRRRTAALYAAVREQAAQDPAAAHARWVAGRDALLASHPASPVLPDDRAGFTGVPVAPYDPAFRFVVALEPGAPQHRDVATGTDGVVPFERIGTVRLGDLGTLDVWALRTYGGGVFLPLLDATCGLPDPADAPGTAAYGGGRYVLDTIKGADLGGAPDALVVDLNFAYNPSCAYDPAWACPLPGEGNTLAAPVPVGERAPAAHA
ncbi:DUF1684 domain-containing protein [Cellulomonas marina]|uniref:DUF1684 domain-containing protein n=1 Tax=Cellulomonas marina TaxID=988821 RepID=UPI0019440501|nr:hypothetical protein Cma02nite_14270 [Cellulomonas marina]